MSLTRRQFLARTVVLGAAARPRAWARPWQAPRAPETLDPHRLAPFVDALPRPRVAAPTSLGVHRLEMREAECQFHRDLPPTRCWTYEGSVPGPLIEAREGEGLEVAWRNALPARHFLPVDTTLDGAGPDLPEVRAVVHLHGGRTEAASDGYPEHWIVPGQEQRCRYANRQDPALLFYHDHAMGLNRLNVYAGLAGLYVIRGAEEETLRLPAGKDEIFLALCDRLLTPQGQLYYPVSGIPGRPWVPEVFGNAVLVNGKLFPQLELAPRAYRWRILNFANGRFFRLALSNRQPLHVIGSDQGLLAAPVPLTRLLLAPAERADVVVDLSGCAGEDLLLLDQGRPILRVRVGRGPAAPAYAPPARLRDLPAPRAAAGRIRRLTLDEYDDLGGNPSLMLLDGKRWRDPVSEQPRLGDTEIWELVNLTDDTHPIHLHEVRFRILDRRAVDVDQYLAGGGVRYLGPARPPAPEERGWKDTVRADGGGVTRILIHFEGYAGRFLWHCHILEHEANAMMRPYDILPARE